ncbi:PREDICTED: serine/threonine-protein kinase RIO3-like [Ceratosolen solmsi marchali]|uniref:Serine/threonine-protein kinase RIO3-like n=1 Tax=Ceratosolen solmsi marchali TaxID=326594 RepID=A0AAJ6YGC6_9HYME|nr:PREDICTED: serine/threonine-protein kinase RIO3-like [Ceratosolen solmsi marchali]
MSAWGKIHTIEEPISFDKITSEQLARSLQEKEIKKYAVTVIEEIPEITEIAEKASELFEIDQTESDAVIAHMLQADLNEEYDLMLKRTEKKFNRDSKVNISYLNYRAGVKEPEEPKADVDDEDRDFDRFVSIEKEYASIPRCGYKKVGDGGTSQIVTKHDMLMTSRINACRVLEFPPGIQTGDTGGFDVKLNNKVFNSLRQHSHAHCSKEKAKAHPKPQTKSQATLKATNTN